MIFLSSSRERQSNIYSPVILFAQLSPSWRRFSLSF
jgi:hypothetical protein